MGLKVIENNRFGEERALYGACDVLVKNCRFEGEEDGESALKECERTSAEACYMDLRYPFWHDRELTVKDCELTANCRAALWYDDGVRVENSVMNGIKAFRECRNISVVNTKVQSPEFCWRCENIEVKNCEVEAQYGFFESKNIKAENLSFGGKYSFQYVADVDIVRSHLNTKDAFWHSEGVTVTDSVLEGEYLGWYSQGLTLIRCHIKGTQPLCYCKNLTLIDCTTEDCDLAFEYSEVNATIKGDIVSIKNPAKGKIVADSIGEIIITDDSKFPVEAEIEDKQKR